MWKWKKISRMAIGPMMAPKDGDEGEGGGAAGADAELEKKIGKMVNSALTSHMGRKPFKDAIAAAVGEHTTPIMERLDQLVSNGNQGGDGGGAGGGEGAGGKPSGGGGNRGVPPEVQRQLDEQAKTIKRLQDEGKKATDEAVAQRRANEQAEERAQLNAALKRAGVSDDRISGAAALIYHEQRKIKRTADGEIRITQKDSYGNNEEVDLDAGLAEWVKTSEGKAYLPPVQVQGGGARGGAPGARGKAEPTEPELLAELGNVLMGGKPTLNLGS